MRYVLTQITTVRIVLSNALIVDASKISPAPDGSICCGVGVGGITVGTTTHVAVSCLDDVNTHRLPITIVAPTKKINNTNGLDFVFRLLRVIMGLLDRISQ